MNALLLIPKTQVSSRKCDTYTCVSNYDWSACQKSSQTVWTLRDCVRVHLFVLHTVRSFLQRWSSRHGWHLEKGYDQAKGWGVMESTRGDFSSKMSNAEHPPYSLSQAFSDSLDRDSYNSHVHLLYKDKHLTITKSHTLTHWLRRVEFVQVALRQLLGVTDRLYQTETFRSTGGQMEAS